MTDTSDFTFYQRMTLYAAAACFADTVTFPLDLAKVRLQVQSGAKGSGLKYKSLLHTIQTVAKEEGPRALYKGLVPGLQRQMCFASVKFGLYDSVKDFYLGLLHAEEGSNVMVRIAAGLTTGFMAVFIAQPTDVIKIRFQASQGVFGEHRSVAKEYANILKQEGVAGLWKGTTPNCLRNGFINCGEIVVYDSVKDFFIKKQIMNDNVYCHFTSGAIAGFCATVIASPFDVIKTRYMSAAKGEYSSVTHVAMETLKEGPLAFYKGFFPSFYRIATWNIVLWISFEQLKILTRKVRESGVVESSIVRPIHAQSKITSHDE
ncbi:mitochondrial uncoupling protein 2 isoform X2 [Nilaparvata lugens]|uniref:mitochondrial uncoupling protein 2 isoform X2 n=1 Tax=Nilaparvata lugens TaxID=108931 RepID=UPI000B98C6AD|nr:mitochondrial uncoupling protein 2 isoform X2 [Nilaparvata lugens]XP_039275862.1 mitochondrial uncoupling protein 2 isoform X2 [Nilaparvata lugens]XP_039275863.1 mitochondrial uncoupling protein 2 isoform X2 [Nilaparvata lugens]XP_039275864.1 mitochondrial uncoupling protein 2 isoform X2 [Nilaparvata lugens]XP_039275865.1 mitochondrial uncoupling protein 2 isoform X2 [Nilaparvata lugens]